MTNPVKQRLVFLGDSITVGVGDSQARGWPSRLCHASSSSTENLHCYNLGIGGDRISDLSRRVATELKARFTNTSGYGVIMMIGVNDALRAAAQFNNTPLEPAVIKADLENVLTHAQRYGAVLAIEPAPVLPEYKHSDGISGTATIEKLEQVNKLLALACEHQGILLLRLTSLLQADSTFMTALYDGDGLHPHDAGYERIASHIKASTEWLEFLKQIKKTTGGPAT